MRSSLSVLSCLLLTASLTLESYAFSISNRQPSRCFSFQLYAADVVPDSDTPSTPAAAASTAAVGEQQALYGNQMELPDTYVRCGRCQTVYALKEEDLGHGGSKGRRLECSVCNHSWFQSKDRLMNTRDGFELIQRPQYEIDRIVQNMQENREPNYMGDYKVYVGNIAFECSEQDIYQAFSEVGNVGDVSLVRDDDGKNRGFGFVTMRTQEGGQAVIEKLNGADIKGRSIAVRPSNN